MRLLSSTAFSLLVPATLAVTPTLTPGDISTAATKPRTTYGSSVHPGSTGLTSTKTGSISSGTSTSISSITSTSIPGTTSTTHLSTITTILATTQYSLQPIDATNTATTAFLTTTTATDGHVVPFIFVPAAALGAEAAGVAGAVGGAVGEGVGIFGGLSTL